METGTVRSVLISSTFVPVLTGLSVLEAAAQTYTFTTLAGSVEVGSGSAGNVCVEDIR